jgi:hypothetical protein
VVPGTQRVLNATSVNFKTSLATRRAKIAPSGITKTKLEYRIALDAFLANFKTYQAMKTASNVPVVVVSMLPLLWVFLLQIVKRVPKVNTNQRQARLFAFDV